MKHEVRLQVYGYWGTVFPPPLTYQLNASALWEKSGGHTAQLSNLVRLDTLGGSSPAARYPAQVRGAALLRLAHSRVFPEADNLPERWMTLGGSAPLSLRTRPFQCGEYALVQVDARPYRASLLRTRNLKLAPNRPFSLNAFLHGTPEGQSVHLWQLRAGRFCLRFRNFEMEALWLSPEWTAPQETELWNLLQLESLTESQLNARDSLTRQLYAVRHTLALGGRDTFENKAFSLDVMPEPLTGRVGVETGAGRRDVLEVPRPEHEWGTRLQFWQDGELEIRCNGGAFFWEMGYPRFAAQGEAVVTVQTPVVRSDLGPMHWSMNADVPPSCQCAVECREGRNVYEQGLAVTLGSASGKYSPLVYAAAVHFEAGARNGSGEVAWDSADHPVMGASPILEARPLWTEKGECRWQVELPLLAGSLLHGLEGFNYPYLEDRVATLWVDGHPVLTRGLITACQVRNMRRHTPNLIRNLVEGPESTLRLTLQDGWGICRETLLTSPPVGDGLRAGAYGRRLLRAAGFTLEELALIGENSGGLIRGASPGEEWAEVPASFADVATVLRAVEEKYGAGRRFRQGRDGRWRFEYPAQAVSHSFSSAEQHHDPQHQEGRLVVLRPLDWRRDGARSYNVFVVRGAHVGQGRVLGASYRDFTGRLPSNSLSVLNYRGRWRLCPPLIDPALRTQEACDYALRGLRELYGRSGRTARFETYFHAGLEPGSLVNIDGRLARVERAGGDVCTDTMWLLVREVA